MRRWDIAVSEPEVTAERSKPVDPRPEGVKQNRDFPQRAQGRFPQFPIALEEHRRGLQPVGLGHPRIMADVA